MKVKNLIKKYNLIDFIFAASAIVSLAALVYFKLY
jgi:hypothetical protein